MRRPSQPLSIIRKAAIPALALLVIGNFAGYAIAGPNGLMALGNYQTQLAKRQLELKRVEAQRAELEHKVALLDARHVDPDMADELVRRDMGLARPDEVIIQAP